MDKNEIMEWMRDYIVAHLKVKQEWIEMDMQFDDYGLDSRTSMEMIGEFSERIGRDLDPGVLYDYSTIESLADHIAGIMQETVPC
jgi:acyl carrier protein